MGGRALKKAFTRRYTKEEFEAVSQELLTKIRKTFDRADVPLYYHNKETFGDIDIIVDMNGFKEDIREFKGVVMDKLIYAILGISVVALDDWVFTVYCIDRGNWFWKIVQFPSTTL